MFLFLFFLNLATHTFLYANNKNESANNLFITRYLFAIIISIVNILIFTFYSMLKSQTYEIQQIFIFYYFSVFIIHFLQSTLDNDILFQKSKEFNYIASTFISFLSSVSFYSLFIK